MNKKKKPMDQVDKVIDYKNVFGSLQGKRVLEDLMKITGMLTTSFDENSNTMAFKEGQRNVCIHILHKLKTDHTALRIMIEERENE